MTKDIGYALKEGANRGQNLLTAGVALEIFKRAVAAGHGDKDMAAIVEPMREPGRAKARS
jgi:3-hydroxyisobutyrate dehydrogenase-like beta-hydroxyacid dehydrogenase